jgi:heme-degrading monooxygenase HmoA
MPVIVVTRLRLKDPALLEEFFTAAVASLEQAKGSDGNVGADVLADANNTWWTLTAWQERGLMRAFVGTDPHKSTMARLDDWCDEATFVDWEQASADLPDWPTGYRRLVADGQVASLTHPSDAHETRAFPPPVEASDTGT